MEHPPFHPSHGLLPAGGGGRGESRSPPLQADEPAPAAASAAQRWSEALRRARSDPGSELVMTRLLELASWPELTDLPHGLASPLTRICALLSLKRTAGLLVHRMLDMPRDEVRVLLGALIVLGHVRVAQGGGVPQDGAADRDAEAGAELPPLREESILAKFWRRLTGRD